MKLERSMALKGRNLQDRGYFCALGSKYEKEKPLFEIRGNLRYRCGYYQRSLVSKGSALVD